MTLQNPVNYQLDRDNRFASIVPQLFTVLLLAALISQNTELPQAGAYGVTALAYLFGGIAFVLYSEKEVSIGGWPLVLFASFAAVATLNYVFNPATFNLVRLLVLVVFVSANFYLIPSIVTLDEFLHVTSRAGVVLVAIGLLPLVGVPTQLGFIDISLWGSFSEFEIPIMTSVFVNPNQFGFFTMVGTIAGLHEYHTTQSRNARIVLWVNALGLLSSHYRTGWMALLVAVGLWYVYVLWGREGLVVATVGGIVSMAVGLAMLFGIVPAPRALTEMSLNGRRELWTTSARAFLQKPILGHGFLGTAEIAGNPHNSYLRIFASFGVVGGLLYTALVLGVTVESALESVPPKTWVLTALLVAMLVIQMFNQLSFVGISMRSTMIAVLMGYGIAVSSDQRRFDIEF